MSKAKYEWEVAREEWVKALARKATKKQRERIAELKELALFSEVEILFDVFGWRAPLSQEVWNTRNQRDEKMGLNESVCYLLRVVLGIPVDGTAKDQSVTDETKSKLKELILVGIENGHIETKGEDLQQSARAAINEVFKRLKIKTIKAK